MGEAAVSTRPPTLRQERLAAILADPNNPPRTLKEATLKAGYSLTTASKVPGQVVGGLGTQHAIARRLERQADKARGLDAIVERTIERPELLDDLDARDKLQLGMAAYKLRHDIGEIATPGDGEAHRAKRKLRMQRSASLIVRMYTSGIGPLGWRAPQHVVVSAESESVTTK